MELNSIYKERKEYVEKGLASVLAPVRDFDEIRYALTYGTNQEYIKLTDLIGSVAYINITGLSLHEVFKEICRLFTLCDSDDPAIVPKYVVQDVNRKREIALLFKQEVRSDV